MLIYSIYFFVNVGIFLSVPKLIFSAFQDGAYQYGFNFLFQLINLLISMILVILWINKTSKEDTK